MIEGWSLDADSVELTPATPTLFGTGATYPVTIAGTMVHDVDVPALVSRSGACSPARRGPGSRHTATSRSTPLAGLGHDDPGQRRPDRPHLAEPAPPGGVARAVTRPDPRASTSASGGSALAIADARRARRSAAGDRQPRPLARRHATMPPRSRDSSRSSGSAELVVGPAARGERRDGPDGRGSRELGERRSATPSRSRLRSGMSACPATSREERLGPMPRGRSGGPPSKTQRDRYRERVDREAAAIILQDELDARRNRPSDRVTVRSGRGPREPEMPSWRASDGRGNPPIYRRSNGRPAEAASACRASSGSCSSPASSPAWSCSSS